MLEHRKWWNLFKHEFDNSMKEYGLVLILVIFGIFYVSNLTVKICLIVYLILALYDIISKSVKLLKNMKKIRRIAVKY